MRPKPFASAFLLVLLTTAVGPLNAINLTFLDQAPLRFLTDAGMSLLDKTIIEVLMDAKDGESRSWKGEDVLQDLAGTDSLGRNCPTP